MHLVAFAGLWGCGLAGGEGEKGQTAQADSTRADSARVDSLTRKPLEAVPVEVALARQGDISAYLVFNSTVETEAAVEVYPQISGLVERIAVEEGDRVGEGQALLHIEDEQLRLAAQEAQVNLEHLETGFRRTEEMFRRRLISDQEFENKKYELEQARLRYQKARLELEHATIHAPFSGVITQRHVQVGARVGPSAKLFELIKLDDMIARVFVPGQYLTALRQDQDAVINSDFLPGKRFQGWVKRISPVVDPKSGTFKVTVGLKDRWEYLRPGLFVNVQIITDTHRNAVLVPKEAVVYDGGDRYVFAVEDTVASRIRLDAGYEDSRSVEALSAIEPGIPVVVVGQNGLKDGARVRLVNPPPLIEARADSNGSDRG
jgi:membrane fusion protein (multidrug efflux system)